MHPFSATPFRKVALYTTTLFSLLAANSYSAIVLDRTRLIYPESAQGVSVALTNKSADLPFLVQSWVEDEKGNKIESPFMAVPPLQRVEPNERTLVRIVKVGSVALPADHESVFYLNVKEIPPKSDHPGVLQLALHSRIKLFYRPTSIEPKRGVNMLEQLQIRLEGKHLHLTNPAALHLTIVGLTQGADKKPLKWNPVMMAPKAELDIDLPEAPGTVLTFSHINDYGGQQDAQFNCSTAPCTVVEQNK